MTSLVVQDQIGGSIGRMNVEITSCEGYESFFDEGEVVSHYFNRVGDRKIDLTLDQFPEGYRMSMPEPLDGFESVREYLLSNEDTKERYEELGAQVAFHMSIV